MDEETLEALKKVWELGKGHARQGLPTAALLDNWSYPMQTWYLKGYIEGTR